ncbi:hypothetical protein OC842_004821 [Tilletia horrida]|uniref:DUF4042 domain-containing protein n=1 Tax=Tilletia horrida TaxID=155126 RepID=A0AAN6GBI0_9BASI|nr:hypothetical protein OC842_004821 [Tilletia horrida]
MGSTNDDDARTLSEWLESLGALQGSADAEALKTALDAFQERISTHASSGLHLDEYAHSDEALSALVRVLRALLQGQSASHALTRASTSAVRCIIALIVHGSPALLKQNPRRVHELAGLSSEFESEESATEAGKNSRQPRSSEQALSVRTAAVQLCESALEQASKAGLMIAIDDRPTRPTAFTSLAVRTGSVVADIRSCVASILTASSSGSNIADGSPNLTHAALKAAKALVSASPNVGFRQRTALIFTPPVVSLCSSNDSSTAAAAFSVLSELMNASGQAKSSPDIQPLESVLSQLSQSGAHLSVVRIQAWKALQALIDQDLQSVSAETQQISELSLQILQSSSSDLERQAAMSAVASLLQARATQDLSSLMDENEATQLTLNGTLVAGSSDISPLVRCSAADCILPLAAAGLQGTAHDILVKLLRDSEAPVSAAAARAIGVAFDAGYASAALLMSADERSSRLAEALTLGFRLLQIGTFENAPASKQPREALSSQTSIIKMRAAWSFATMCDKCADAVAAAHDGSTTFERLDLVPFLQAAEQLCGEDDRLAASGLRALGALLRMVPRHNSGRNSAEAGMIFVSVTTLQRALRHGKDPKTRWNAGAAFERSFENAHFLHRIGSDGNDSKNSRGSDDTVSLRAIVNDLTTTIMLDKMFKVKLTALQALTQLCTATALPDLDRGVVTLIRASLTAQRDTLQQAKVDLDARAEEAAPS